jgi:hypothetical protein
MKLRMWVFTVINFGLTFAASGGSRNFQQRSQTSSGNASNRPSMFQQMFGRQPFPEAL